MQTDNVDGLRQARSQIGHSLRIASMDYIPREGKNNGNGKKLSGDGNVREKVKFLFNLNPKKREKWQENAEIFVPYPNFRQVLGHNGHNIQALQVKN